MCDTANIMQTSHVAPATAHGRITHNCHSDLFRLVINTRHAQRENTPGYPCAIR